MNCILGGLFSLLLCPGHVSTTIEQSIDAAQYCDGSAYSASVPDGYITICDPEHGSAYVVNWRKARCVRKAELLASMAEAVGLGDDEANATFERTLDDCLGAP